MAADAILIQEGYPRVKVDRESARRWVTLSKLANVDKSDAKYHQFVELIRKALVQLLETELNLLGAGAISTPISLPVLAYPVNQKPTIKAHGISVKGLI